MSEAEREAERIALAIQLRVGNESIQRVERKLEALREELAETLQGRSVRRTRQVLHDVLLATELLLALASDEVGYKVAAATAEGTVAGESCQETLETFRGRMEQLKAQLLALSMVIE